MGEEIDIVGALSFERSVSCMEAFGTFVIDNITCEQTNEKKRVRR